MVERMGFEKNRRFVVDWHNQPQRVTIGGQDCKFKSKQERKWADYLQILKDTGVIADWKYEPKTFWFDVKQGVRSYKPDFLIVGDDGKTLWYEVKVHLVQKDITKFRRMKKYYPDEKLILVMDTPSKKRVNILASAERFVERIIYARPIFKQWGIK